MTPWSPGSFVSFKFYCLIPLFLYLGSKMAVCTLAMTIHISQHRAEEIKRGYFPDESFHFNVLEQGMVVHAYNPSILWEVEAGGLKFQAQPKQFVT